MSDPRQFNRSGQDRNNRDLLSWIPIVIFLFCFPPLGLFLLILRLVGVTGRRRGQVGRHPYDLQREAAAQDGTTQGDAAAASTQAGRRPAAEGLRPGQGREKAGGAGQRTAAHHRRGHRGRRLWTGGFQRLS